jgi:uncharacterized protein DUF6065
MKRHPTITALRLFDTSFTVSPSPRHRAWMDATTDRFAYRCLPLVMANQAGWIIRSGRTVLVTWSGGRDVDDLTIEVPDGEQPPASSQFGFGILTWEIPFLFRTSPGYNLLARGPANWWKEGAVPLEGVVETDWAVATFTMNWKITSPAAEIRFEPDDPICMIVPQRRGELEAFRPRLERLESESEVERQFQVWRDERNEVLPDFEDPGRAGNPASWQQHYLRGTSPGGASASTHQIKLHLLDFADSDEAHPERS